MTIKEFLNYCREHNITEDFIINLCYSEIDPDGQTDWPQEKDISWITKDEDLKIVYLNV